MLYIKNIVFFTSHQKGCESTPSPSHTHVFSLIFLHFASDLSHNSEIFHPLVYAHAEGTPSGALPEQPSRDASLYLPRKDGGERVRGGAVQVIYKTGRKLE